MRIAICDDVTKDRLMIESSLRAYLAIRGLKAEVESFSTPKRLLDTARRTPFDLYLLDVLLAKDSTGIDLARRLRGDCANVPIIFLSTSREYAFDAFDVEAVSYLAKPWTQDAFFRALDRGTEAHRRAEADRFVFRTTTGVVRFDASQLECVMTAQTVNYVTISRAVGEPFTLRGSVRNFESEYGSRVRLVPAGRSILINPAQILSLNGVVVRFFSGRTVEVPRSSLPVLSREILSLSSPLRASRCSVI